MELEGKWDENFDELDITNEEINFDEIDGIYSFFFLYTLHQS